MPTTPGRPCSPTLHPRTKPEADSIARRARSTADWFRHDGHNVEPPAAPPTRAPDPRTVENAERGRGDAESWFEHHSEVVEPEPVAEGRGLMTESGRACAKKIHGEDEKWYAHDDNADYVSPRKPPKLTDVAAFDNQHNFADVDTNDWYKQHRGPDAAFVAEPAPPAGQEGVARLESSLWSADADAKEPTASHSRLTTADAESYLDRNRAGSAGDWFSHHSEVDTPRYAATPRVASLEGQQIACRNRGESEDWFSYTPRQAAQNAPPSQMAGEPGTVQVVDLLQPKSTPSPVTSPSKSEEGDAAQRNMRGMMDKFLKEDPGYTSARPAPRIRPEAGDAAERNRGTMQQHIAGDGSARGYPDPVSRSRNVHTRVRPEGQQYADRNKGTAGKLIYDQSPAPNRGGADRGRRLRPEAADNAARNKGSMQGLIGGCEELSVSPRPPTRGNSDLAQQFADRNRGTVGSLLNPGM